MIYSLNLAIPNMGETYQASASLLNWVVNAFLLASAAFLLPFGRLADIVGRKKLFMLGLAISAVTCFICAVSWSIEWLIVFRIVQGVGAALGFSTAVAILTSVYPPEERGKVLGYNSAVVYFGLSLGPAVGGFLTFHWGWPSIFIFCGIIYLILFVLAVSLIKGEWKGPPGYKYDVPGAVIYVVGLIAFLYGLSSLQEFWVSWLVLLGGLLLILVFIRRVFRIENPLLPLRLLTRNRVFAFSSLATFANYSATFAIMFLMSLYLQSLLHHDTRIAGFVLLAQPVIMVIVSPFSGRLSDRVNPRIVSFIGMAITTMSLFLFAFIGLDTPMYLIVSNLAVCGVGFGLFASPNSNAVMGSVEKSSYGLASAALGSMRMIGQSLSMAVAALILSGFVGYVQLSLASPTLLLAGIRTTFAVFGVISFLGLLAIWRSRTTKSYQ